MRDKMQVHMAPIFENAFPPFEVKDPAPAREAGISLFGMDMGDPSSSDQDDDPRGSRKVIYTCAFPGCDGVFNSTSNKKRHEKLHSGEKPHKCDYSGCGKSFARLGTSIHDSARKYDLKVHKRTHTKEKPYTCEVVGCNKRFSRNSSLREHERNIHNLTVGQSRAKVAKGDGTCKRVESKPRDRSESRRYERESKMYLPLDGQSKAQVQELVNLFKATQQMEGKVAVDVKTVTSLLDIRRERAVTRAVEPKAEEGETFQGLPPLGHLYTTYAGFAEGLQPSEGFALGQGCERPHHEEAENEQGLLYEFWNMPH